MVVNITLETGAKITFIVTFIMVAFTAIANKAKSTTSIIVIKKGKKELQRGARQWLNLKLTIIKFGNWEEKKLVNWELF